MANPGGGLLLAPMEGLMDATLRDLLTRVGGVERCVSEFIRITDTLLPERVFHRMIPELRQGGVTPAGVPVRAQLLGSDPACLADNAARLSSLGPEGIDLNFGCPARTVNRHRGGAALLEEPELIGRIVEAVRRALPPGLPLSAKMRLGLKDDRLAVDCAQAIEGAGAVELVVHARTQAHGYRPPAYWERIGDIRAKVRLPVVANGEIWTVADARRCRELSGCDRLMLGRGMVADPGLALAVLRDRSAAGVLEAAFTELPPSGLSWTQVLGLLEDFWHRTTHSHEPRHRAGRLKQWLQLLRLRHPEAAQAYQQLRTVHDSRAIALGLFCREPTALE
ncbi:MAG: tRNA-dihydrouridine synthase [Burkholderiales bacterium]|jgi:tRNA-dihydrouridine synthase C|nr:tRNA-dihydrouridine synthase [Burkholderiales bacterium]MBP7519651.1 tRNA-dihydrouridine synthase [Leptothrix sp. (in: b-proteobacteria)]HQY08897.1 tRNA-dihydrouridine synthase [Burkholderiaceae bacterium]